jgi:hypothetical protein
MTTTTTVVARPREGWRERVASHPFVVAVLLTILSASVYLIHYNYCQIGDTVPAELLPINLLNGDGFDFTKLQPPGQPLHYGFVKNGNRVVSFYPVIPGVLNVPVYAIAKTLGVDLMARRFELSGYTCVWISAVSVGLMYLALSRICKSVFTAIALALIYAFATAVWSITSRCLWQHGPSILLLSGAIALLLFKSKRWMPYCGFLLGMAVWNRPTNVVFAIPIALYIILNHRDRLVPFIISAAIPALLLIIYSHVYWGSVIALGQGHRVGGTQGPHHTNFDAPLLVGLAGVLVSPSRGLFVFGPMFVFSFVYFGYALVSRTVDPLYKYLAIGALGHLFIFAKWSVWWGGYSFAYRMLIEMLPVLVPFAAAAWEARVMRAWPLRSAFVLCVLTSVYLHFLGAYYYPSGFNYSPDSIDLNTQRLWSWRDGEIARCHANFLADLRQSRR